MTQGDRDAAFPRCRWESRRPGGDPRNAGPITLASDMHADLSYGAVDFCRPRSSYGATTISQEEVAYSRPDPPRSDLRAKDAAR